MALLIEFATVPLPETEVLALEHALMAWDLFSLGFSGDDGAPWRGRAAFAAGGADEPNVVRLLAWLRADARVLPLSLQMRIVSLADVSIRLG